MSIAYWKIDKGVDNMSRGVAGRDIIPRPLLQCGTGLGDKAKLRPPKVPALPE